MSEVIGVYRKPSGVTVVPGGQATPVPFGYKPLYGSLEHFGVIGVYVGG